MTQRFLLTLLLPFLVIANDDRPPIEIDESNIARYHSIAGKNQLFK